MSEEQSALNGMNFTLAELTRIKLEPGEVLAVKLFGDDYDVDNVEALSSNLRATFPNNKIMVFVLPNGNDLTMEAVKGSEEVEKQGFVKVSQDIADIMNSKQSCSTVNYCSDCSCGKKAQAEAQNESKSESGTDLSGSTGAIDDSNKLRRSDGSWEDL